MGGWTFLPWASQQDSAGVTAWWLLQPDWTVCVEEVETGGSSWTDWAGTGSGMGGGGQWADWTHTQ